MIQVQEDKAQGLKRALTITVPRADIEQAKTTRLQAIATTANIQGFRPGKAPLHLIQQRFGEEVEGEVVDKLMTDAMNNAISERKWRPAAQPDVDIAKDNASDKDVSFTVKVEIWPEIKPMDFGKLTFEKQVADVADKTVDEAIERIAKSMRGPEPISTPRAAGKGDTVVIDFAGTVDGVAHDGMKSESHHLELGSNSFIPGFEDQIVGMKASERKDIKVTFPTEYHAKHLAGKQAVFDVTVKEIRAHKPVEINDELGKEVGFPSLAKLRERIAADIGKNYGQISRSVLKRELMDKLADAHSFELPEVLVEAEFNGIWQEVLKDKAAGRLDADDAKKSDDALKAEYREIAERRVRLGLLLAHVAEENKIAVEPAELQSAIMAQARQYPGQEKAVIEYITKNREAIERLRAPILEEKVVDFILAKAKITEKKIDAEKLLALPNEE